MAGLDIAGNALAGFQLGQAVTQADRAARGGLAVGVGGSAGVYVGDLLPGALAGDENALAALAERDFGTFLKVEERGIKAEERGRRNALDMREQDREDARFEMDQGADGRDAAMHEVDLEKARIEGQRAATEWQWEMDDRERDRVVAEAVQDIAIADRYHEAGDREGYAAFIAQNPELDPEIYTFDNHYANVARIEGALDVVRNARELANPPGPDFRPATPEEAAQYGEAAGQIGPDGRFYATGQAPTEPSAAEAEIARIQELTSPDGDPFTREEAIRIADLFHVGKDPQTEEWVVTDKSTGQPVDLSPPARPGEGAPSDAVPPAEEPLPPVEGLPDSFGAEGAIKRGINRAAGAVGADSPFPDVEAAQAYVAVLREGMISDLASGYPRQPPAALMERLDALAPEAGKVFSGLGQARSQAEAMRVSIDQERRSLAQQITSRALSPDRRQEMEGQLVSLQLALSRIDHFIASLDAGAGGEGMSGEIDGVPWRVVK